MQADDFLAMTVMISRDIIQSVTKVTFYPRTSLHAGCQVYLLVPTIPQYMKFCEAKPLKKVGGVEQCSTPRPPTAGQTRSNLNDELSKLKC